MNLPVNCKDQEMHGSRMDTGGNGGEARSCSAEEARKKVLPKKLWGCIAAPPRVPFNFPKEAYLFFLAFFFAAILFSSELFRFFRQRSRRSAYSFIMFRVTELSCQEESDC